MAAPEHEPEHRVLDARQRGPRAVVAHAADVELDPLVERRHGRLHVCLLGFNGRAVVVHDLAQRGDLGFISRALRRKVFERGIGFVLEGSLVAFELGLPGFSVGVHSALRLKCTSARVYRADSRSRHPLDVHTRILEVSLSLSESLSAIRWDFLTQPKCRLCSECPLACVQSGDMRRVGLPHGRERCVQP